MKYSGSSGVGQCLPVFVNAPVSSSLEELGEGFNALRMNDLTPDGKSLYTC